jgi:hypothetical protein
MANFFTRNNTIIVLVFITIVAGIILALQYRTETMATLGSEMTGVNKSVIDKQIECVINKGDTFNYVDGNISLGHARLPSAHYFEALDTKKPVNSLTTVV